MKKNYVALVMIAIMAVSVFGAVNLTTSMKAEAATPTVTFLSAPAFAQYGQTISLTGNVKTSTGGTVARGSVALYRWSATAGWAYWQTVPISYATFTATDTATIGTHQYQARYLGGSLYGTQFAASTSLTRSTTVKFGTTMSIASLNYPWGNAVAGYVKNLNFISKPGVQNQIVYVYKFNAQQTGNRWVLFTQVRTDANGAWHVNDYQPYTTNYYAQFPETSTYFGSQSSVTPGV